MSYFTGTFDREWFTLEQAIAEIKELYDEEITTQDLLHFARNGRIDLKLKVELLSGNRLLAFGESKNISSKLSIKVEDLDYFLKRRVRTACDIFKFGELIYSSTEDSEYIKGINHFITYDFTFSGLLDIDNNLIDEFSDIITVPALSTLTNYNRKHLFRIEILDDLIIPTSKVVILRDDLDHFMRLMFESDDEQEESDTEKDEIIESQRAENETLRAQIAELEKQVKEQSAVNSEQVLDNGKAYDVRERETHLLMIGAFSNLLAANKPKYQKGKGKINQSAISRDIADEIIELLQPETKSRTPDTIRPRIRESIELITKAE